MDGMDATVRGVKTKRSPQRRKACPEVSKGTQRIVMEGFFD
jgi:hypothetical protein